MVKSLDENQIELIDHVGWRVWRLAKAWKEEFDQEMAARGHGWFSEARSNVLPHLNRDGTVQSALQSRMGVTKQAVQQFVDELVADGIIERRVNPDDRRSNVIHFTRKGQRVLADANGVKIKIQARYRSKLGAANFTDFMACLDVLEGSEPPKRSPAVAAGRLR
jgi:DNA-binding MarR family transcriptional regulator